MNEIGGDASIRITGSTRTASFNDITPGLYAGLQIYITPKTPSFYANEKVVVQLNDRVNLDMARAMIAGLRDAGFETHLIKTYTQMEEL